MASNPRALSVPRSEFRVDSSKCCNFFQGLRKSALRLPTSPPKSHYPFFAEVFVFSRFFASERCDCKIGNASSA
jgi:hypothetical protein